MEKYTKRQQQHAEQARTTYRTLGSLTTQNFKHILRQNLIKNCPVTVKDVEIAEDIFGPDITTLKGKSTRKRPPVIIDDQVDIPDELLQTWNDITLCIDNMFVQGQAFLVAINTTIRDRLATHLKNQSTQKLFVDHDRIICVYNAAGYCIGNIHCDREF